MGISLSLRLRPLLFALLVGLCLAGSASAARAASIDVFFDGPVQSDQHFGLSAAGAAAAQLAGVAVVAPEMRSAGGDVEIVDQQLEAQSLTLNDLVAPFTATSTWTAENTSDTNISDIVYLVFTTAGGRLIDLSTGPVMADYDETQVGLRIDPATGWVLLQTSTQALGALYYPAIPLGPLAPGQQKQFDVNYVLNQLLSFPDGDTTYVPLPQLRIAIVVVPEPGTALLLGAGLLGLAFRARKRT